MDDEKLLSYARIHSDTPRSMFKGVHIHQLVAYARKIGAPVPDYASWAAARTYPEQFRSIDLGPLCDSIEKHKSAPRAPTLTLIRGGKYS